VGAAIFTGVKLVTPLAMAGTWMSPLVAAGRGLTRRDEEAHTAIRTGGTRLTRRDAGIPPLVLAGQGERREKQISQNPRRRFSLH